MCVDNLRCNSWAFFLEIKNVCRILVCDETALKADLGSDLPQAAAGSWFLAGLQASHGHAIVCAVAPAGVFNLGVPEI